MPTWTTQQVEALAPDAASAKAGKGLASLGKWKTLGCTEHVAWGECQGSGKDPYQTQVEFSEPAFRCSCPSRKFPCKHGLGLMLVYAAQPAAFKDNSPPAWVTDWLAGRTKRAEQKSEKDAAKAERGAQPVDVAAQAKRANQRLAKVTAGLDYVETWLCDLVRSGLTGVPGQPYGFWETPAARMVDAQAPGVARLIRELSGIANTGDDWQERLLARLGRLYLLIEGFRHLDALPAPTQADIRSLVGWTVKEDELFASVPPGEGVRDQWLITAQRVEDDERVRVQRTWLRGRTTGRDALLLHFAAFNQQFDHAFATGSGFEGELVYFPSAHPLRALIRTRQEGGLTGETPAGYPSIALAVEGYAAALSAQPWLEEFPVILERLFLLRHGDGWIARDEAGGAWPVMPSFARGWHLLAVSGGHPVTLAGEWNGTHLLPLSCWTTDGFHPLPPPV
jgi:hypothetical protein